MRNQKQVFLFLPGLESSTLAFVLQVKLKYKYFDFFHENVKDNFDIISIKLIDKYSKFILLLLDQLFNFNIS